jgi:3-oxoacyl-[acyl-carrier-protein] synthase-3
VTRARITATGSDLPERVLTNAELEGMVETSDVWIRERTGIRERHIVAPEESTADLAERATRRALDAAGRDAGAIDLIVVATTTPDRVFPSTACLLQARLGIHGCAAFDIQAVCTGFVYALGVADKFIRTGAARCALVLGAETISRIIDWTDRSTCVLFGDGAGAAIVEASEEPGIHSTHLHADGHYAELLHVPQGVSQEHDEVAAGRAFVEMKGNEVFKMATNTLGRIVDERQERRLVTAVWGDMLEFGRDPDGLFVNLEWCLSNRGRPWRRRNRPFHFRATPDWAVPVLKAAALDDASRANNHVLDFEEPAQLDTLQALDRAGIAHAGAGRTESEARAPAGVSVGDRTVVVVAFTDNTPEYAAGPESPGVAHVEFGPEDTEWCRPTMREWSSAFGATFERRGESLVVDL